MLENREYSDHSTVYLNLVLPLGEEDKEEELNNYLTEIPLLDVDAMEEEDWAKYRKNLHNQNWVNVSIMSTTDLQNLLTKNIEEAIKQSTKKRRTKKKGKNIPVPIRRFIKAKKKAICPTNKCDKILLKPGKA